MPNCFEWARIHLNPAYESLELLEMMGGCICNYTSKYK